jgi:hypothetical protein
MYKVSYYPILSEPFVEFKEFSDLDKATQFALSLEHNSVLEIKHYDENSTDYRSTLWSKK